MQFNFSTKYFGKYILEWNIVSNKIYVTWNVVVSLLIMLLSKKPAALLHNVSHVTEFGRDVHN